MSEAQLSIRSDQAHKLAHKLAREQHRTVTKVVELALEDYARRSASGVRSWAQFVKDLEALPRAPDEPDVDVAELAREGWKMYRGIDLE